MKFSQSFLGSKDGSKFLVSSSKQRLCKHMQHSVLKCYTVTLHFKKEGMYNKYLKIQHLFWQVNKQENNHPFSPFFLQKWLPFEKGCEPFNLWDVPVSFCTINVTFSRKTNFANGFANLKFYIHNKCLGQGSLSSGSQEIVNFVSCFNITWARVNQNQHCVSWF